MSQKMIAIRNHFHRNQFLVQVKIGNIQLLSQRKDRFNLILGLGFILFHKIKTIVITLLIWRWQRIHARCRLIKVKMMSLINARTQSFSLNFQLYQTMLRSSLELNHQEIARHLIIQVQLTKWDHQIMKFD